MRYTFDAVFVTSLAPNRLEVHTPSSPYNNPSPPVLLASMASRNSTPCQFDTHPPVGVPATIANQLQGNSGRSAVESSIPCRRIIIRCRIKRIESLRRPPPSTSAGKLALYSQRRFLRPNENKRNPFCVVARIHYKRTRLVGLDKSNAARCRVRQVRQATAYNMWTSSRQPHPRLVQPHRVAYVYRDQSS